MIKHLTIITIVAVCSLLWISSEAFSDMDPFANPQPTYEFDWVYGTGTTTQGNNGDWYSAGLNYQIAQSMGDGTAYNNGHSSCYWTPISGMVDGFSLTNNIGDWLDLIGTGKVAILIMLFHAIWATWVLIKKDEKLILSFHKFSVIVWIIWMIPMLSGMILGAGV